MNLLPENIKNRLIPGGKLYKELKTAWEIKKDFPKSKYANSILQKFVKKYFLGSHYVRYIDILSEAWLKLFPGDLSSIIEIDGLKFIWDEAFQMNFSDIFIAGNFLKEDKFDQEKIVAKKVISLLSKEGPYEYQEVTIKKDDIVIDAGANMGLFSLFSIAKGAKKVFAYEPQSGVLPILKRNILMNNFENSIDIIPLGLSDINGNYKLSHSPTGHSAASILIQRNFNNDYEMINCVKLDDYVIINNINRIDFIKADIEGAERLMLKGAANVLKRFKPKLAICTYHFKDDPKVIKEIILKANPKYNIYQNQYKLYAY